MSQIQQPAESRPVDPARANRLRRARAIFTCACDMPADERAAFIEDACGGDGALQCGLDTLG